MPRSPVFHIQIPKICPLCHKRRPLTPPLMCPHLRDRLRYRHALALTRTLSLPPPYETHCCPTYPGCLCGKTPSPKHFSRLGKTRTTTISLPPAQASQKMVVQATEQTATTWAFPGSCMYQEETVSR